MAHLACRIAPMGLVVAGLACGGTDSPGEAAEAYWPGEAWRTSSPEAQGLSSAALADAVEAIDERDLAVHSLLIVRNGYLVLDAYFPPYDGRTPHDLASVTKSVTTTLVGIAIERGDLPDLDEPVLSVFDDFEPPDDDARRRAMTIEHLVSMTTGMACYGDPDEPQLTEMLASDNWVEYALSLPMRAEPGTEFSYCSPGMHLLSAMIERGTGESSARFAEERLFDPLGIEEYVWPNDDPQGITNGWGDLRLHPHDMARLGYLFLKQGRWNGRQVVPSAWVEAATHRHIDVPEHGDDGYGYGWWMYGGPFEGVYLASGRGGQTILVWPEQEVVLVSNGADYDRDSLLQMLALAVRQSEPLPDDPKGAARLTDAIEAAQADVPEPRKAPVHPAIAAKVSGVRFSVEPNPFGVAALELRFSADKSTLVFFSDEGNTSELEIGFDGVPRVSKDARGIPLALAGEWTTPTSLQVDYVETSGYKHFVLTFGFSEDGNGGTIDVRDVTGMFGTTSWALSPETD